MRSITHGKVSSIVGGHPWKSAKLLNNYLIVLRGIFAVASRDLKIENAMDGVNNQRHQAKGPDPLQADETAAILDHMRQRYDMRVFAYFLFAFTTGMRPEEIIGLRWQDIDWNLRQARIERAKTAGEIKPLKTYVIRDVDLVPAAMGALNLMKTHTFMKGEEAEVFQNPVTGKSWHDERSQRDHYWKPTLRKLGIRARKAYQARHTYATRALMAGVAPAYIARQLGHKNTQMLFRVYAKWIDGADGGNEKRRLEAASISPVFLREPSELVASEGQIGRRDWTRTNDPHHVKVVL